MLLPSYAVLGQFVLQITAPEMWSREASDEKTGTVVYIVYMRTHVH